MKYFMAIYRCIGWVLYKLTVIGFANDAQYPTRETTPDEFINGKALEINPKFEKLNRIAIG